jgi:predicted nucleotidyltransferase
MGSRTRSKILSLFFSYPDEEFYVREVVRKVGENYNSVRRELTKLTSVGVLLSTRRGNLRYFQVNKDLPIFDELKMIFIKTEGIGNELIEILKKQKKIHLAFLYGSWAEGKEKFLSDIDLFIVGKVDEEKLIRDLNIVEKRLSREINYVIFDRNELKRKLQKRDPFVKNVMEGKKIILAGELSEFY